MLNQLQNWDVKDAYYSSSLENEDTNELTTNKSKNEMIKTAYNFIGMIQVKKESDEKDKSEKRPIRKKIR